MRNRQWVSNEIPEEEIKRISEEAEVSGLVAKVFLNRGINDTAYIRKFLNPSMDNLHDPFLFEDMGKCVDRLISAINKSEKIVIYGDYDVDGVTSTSILYSFLLSQNADVDYYIPDRMEEGYGISINAIDKLHSAGTQLIVSVDCGITAVEEVEYIKNKGIDIIITDHHECKDELPRAFGIISPCVPGSSYPFKELAGVGVVYKLIHALVIRMNLGALHEEYLDLVAIGTVADVVPLVDENRVLVKYGITKAEKSQNVGLRTLLECCGLKDKPLNTWTISFLLSPRINAAGRIGSACRGVRLFTTDDSSEAFNIVNNLNEENKYRQDTEADILQAVISTIESDEEMSADKVIVVSGEGWHHGIIGIVASRITERFFKPCILISTDEGSGKGSGRSIEGFDLFKALTHCENLLEKFGGHELAAGLSLKSENIPVLRKMINLHADEILSHHSMVPRVKIDALITGKDLIFENVKELERLAPFGAGNPQPVFEYDGLKLTDIRIVGDNKHLKLKLDDNGLAIDAIGFNMGERAGSFTVSDRVDAACYLEINSWNSVDRIQLNLKDIRPSYDKMLEDFYYSSLENCIEIGNADSDKASGINPDDMIGFKNEKNTYTDLYQVLELEGRTAILVNSLKSARTLDKVLKKSTASIKKSYRICYTGFNSSETEEILVIVNPGLGQYSWKEFKNIIIYGPWFDELFLKHILREIDAEKLGFFNDIEEAPLDLKDVVPDRMDLVAVYQYIKANSSAGRLECNLYTLSKDISISYKIKMNYFKLKKIIEIFMELQLLTVENEANPMVTIVIYKKGEKTNIENSPIYRRLQRLKEYSRTGGFYYGFESKA